MSIVASKREDILAQVRLALRRDRSAPIPPPPGRIAPRQPAAPDLEMTSLLTEISKLGGEVQQVRRDNLRDAFDVLVRDEGIRKATLWQTEELRTLGVEAVIRGLGVAIVSPYAGKHALAECDLGVTGADAAFPETGTLLLRSTPQRPRMVSLAPRIHLALVTPEILLPDLSQGFEQVKGEGYWVFVTGPSRTADIELTVTVGVHGPKALHVWSIAQVEA
jgi:L-lactate dehydrogenase complex protein LldG